MIRITLLLFALQFFAQAQSTIALFNQKDLQGWYAYGQDSVKHKDASELFVVENNTIRLYGKTAGYLMSEQSFQDFRLTVEFRWNTDSTFARKSNKRNSGVMYWVPTDAPDMLWPKGIQFQIKDGATGDFVLLQEVTLLTKGSRTEPGRSVVVPKLQDAIRPLEEWNTLEVTCAAGKIKQVLNGTLVNEGEAATVSEGRILLQYEGYPIDFRKVEIERL
jgi:hypothetical protein